MKRRVIMIILILLTFVLQTTLMQTFAIASVSPNLPIILTVSFALMRGKREGMFVGAFFGILMDIFYGPVLGFHMLLFTYVVVYRLLLALNHKLEKAEQRSVGSFV